MAEPRHRLIVASALALVALSGAFAAAAQAPTLGKPRPAPPPSATTLPPLPPAAYDETLLIGGDDLTARRSNTRMTVEVLVNGRGPYKFLVDSGADTSVVGVRIAQDLRLPMSSPVVLNAFTSRNVVDRVRVDELTLGQSRIRDLHLPALREQHLGGEGMIGIDALVNQRLMMDYEKLAIKVEDASVPVKSIPGEIVITARRQRGQLILTEVKADRLSLDAVIDTGSEVTVGNRALRDKLLGRSRNRDRFFTASATGVTGVTIDVEMAIISQLKLGPITLRDVPIAFADLPPFEVFGMSKQPALLLGTDILETFRRVSLDFRARKVRFQLKQCGSTGVILSTAATNYVSRLSTSSDEACRR